MKDMFRGWWTGPVLFALIGAPVASAVVVLIELNWLSLIGEPFDPLMLLFAAPLSLVLGDILVLFAGFPAVLLSGVASVVLARSRIGTAPYILLMAAASALLAVAGWWLNVLGLARGEAFHVQAWSLAAGWAAGAVVVCGLLRRKGLPAKAAGA